MPGTKAPMTMLDTAGAKGPVVTVSRATARTWSSNARRKADAKPMRSATAPEVTAPDHGAAAEQHPVPRTGVDALAEAAGDEIDQEHHMRHQPGGHQGVFQIEDS